MDKDQKDFHKSRRKEFAKQIGKDSIAIIFGNTLINKSYDADYNFSQNRNFYYLTGFNEPNSALLLAPDGLNIDVNKKSKAVKEVLYVQKKDHLAETWNGKRLGRENVRNELGIENGIVNSDLKAFLNNKNLQKYSKLYINFSGLIKLTGEMKSILSDFMNYINIIASHIELIDASYLLGKMRAVKAPFELKQIKKACEISRKSYMDTMKKVKPGIYEYQVQANLQFNYQINSGEDAYPPIVAGGNNACILHYNENNKILKNGELLLIDSGAEYNYYCSDITRTFPINGKFTKEQKVIYEIVLDANKKCIKKIRQGVKYSELKALSEKVLADGLFNSGILKNKKDILKFSLHGVGHHIGLDTHDAVPYVKTTLQDNDTLKEGNVLTIEPGLYFPKGSKGIEKRFWGIGVRIEDDILVKRGGNINLTEGVVKEIGEIEMWMGRTD